MKFSGILAAAAASTLALALAEDAPITQNNPAMASIQANLQISKDVQGTITGVSNTNGTGANFNINFYAFPSTGGPFSYYISSSTVPLSNACSSLTAPFNPYRASSKCDPSDPGSCAVGALSEKHGVISTASDSSFQKFYLDLYLSTASGTEAYFGAKSIVVADKSGVLLNCANFVASGTGTSLTTSSATVASATSSMSSAISSASSAASSASASAATSSAAAVPGRVVGSGAGLLAVVAALVL